MLTTGDPLLGQDVANVPPPGRGVFSSLYSLNDLGQFAFEARLTDGRLFAVVASPAGKIPIASAAALGALGLGVMGLARRQRADASTS